MERRNPLLDPTSPFMQRVDVTTPVNEDSPLTKIDKAAQAYSSAAVQGAYDSGVIPAKWMSAAARSVLPESISQYVPTPEHIQQAWEDKDKQQRENPYPGTGALRAITGIGGTIGQLALMKNAAASQGVSLPGTAGFLAKTIGAGIFQGGTSADEGVGMWNTPASIVGGTVAGILGPVQYAANKVLAYTKTPDLVAKISKTANGKEVQGLINKHFVPDSNYINISSAIPDINTINPKLGSMLSNLEKLSKSPAFKSLANNYQTVSGSGPGFAGAAANLPSQAVNPSILEKLSNMANKAGSVELGALGGTIGGGVGYAIDGKDGATAGAAIGTGAGITSRFALATPQALVEFVKNKPALQGLINKGADLFTNASAGQFFLNKLTQIGVYPVVQGSNVLFVHKDDPAQPNAYQKMSPEEHSVVNSPEAQENKNPLLRPGSPFIK
jgi:hypothetical protein